LSNKSASKKNNRPIWFVIQNSERRYWRGETLRSSPWTVAIALAHKFQTRGKAVTKATVVGGEKIAKVTKGNVVIEVTPL
jgi:hypothetical protein